MIRWPVGLKVGMVELRAGVTELRHYRDLLRRWWLPLVLGLLLGGGIGFALSQRKPAIYSAQTYLLINQIQNPTQPGIGDLTLSQTVAQSYAQLIRSRPFLEETSRQLGLSTAPIDLDELRKKIIVIPAEGGTQYLAVTVRDPDPTRAATIVNALAQNLIQQVQDARAGNVQPVQREIDRELDEARQRVTEASNLLYQLRARPSGSNDDAAEVLRLQNDLELYRGVYLNLLDTQRRLRLEQLQAPRAISVVLPAGVPTEPEPRGTLQNTLLSGFAGLLLIIGVAIVGDFLNDRLREPEELRRRFNLAPLAVVPLAGGQGRSVLDLAMTGDDQLRESLQALRSNIEFVTMGHPMAICVRAALRDEGASTIAALVAITEARAGKRVVLVDANLRDPALGHLFGLDNEHGLSTFLAQLLPADQPPLQDGPFGLRILVSGPIPPNSAELLGSPQMAELIAQLRLQADLIVLDGSPILSFADTPALQRVVDGTILVMDVQGTETRTLQRALSALQEAAGLALGVVLNKDTRGLSIHSGGEALHRAPSPENRTVGRDHSSSAPTMVGAGPSSTHGADSARTSVRAARDD